MGPYSPLVNQLLAEEGLLERLLPLEPGHPVAIQSIREASEESLLGGAMPAEPEYPRMIRAGLLYAYDALRESHRILQEIGSAEASYWHGMIHRREGDFENARYWFRRTGVLPAYSEMHMRASAFSPLMARQQNWDPYPLVGECEQARFGGDVNTPELVALQKIEFEVMFAQLWRGAFA